MPDLPRDVQRVPRRVVDAALADPEFRALAEEMQAMQVARKQAQGVQLGFCFDAHDRFVFVVQSGNGHHESHDGFVAALRDMVEAHR
jgi:hypothetical protein